MQLEQLELAVYSAAEQLASEVDKNGLTGHPMEVIFNNEILEFTVDVIITNFEYEAETNSQSFNVEVFCVAMPMRRKDELYWRMVEKFYLETLYKD